MFQTCLLDPSSDILHHYTKYIERIPRKCHVLESQTMQSHKLFPTLDRDISLLSLKFIFLGGWSNVEDQ